MPRFAYLAVDPRGRERRGDVQASDAGAARANLESRKLYILKLAAAGHEHIAVRKRDWLPDFLTTRRLSAKELTLFTRQLATMTKVSPLEESLRIIARQSEREHVRTAVARVADGVVEGRRLADAMSTNPRSFPPLYRAMVAAGESSGSLPELLDRLSQLLERQSEMRGKILSALAYPIVLTLVAVAVVATVMIAVVPKVVEQFDNVGQQLPLLTRIVIAISSFLAQNWMLLLLALPLLGLLGWRLLQEQRIRHAVDRWVLRLPLLGRLFRDLHAARMARTLSTMIESRLPVIEGLRLTAGTIHNRALRSATEDMVSAIRAGGSLSGAMARAGVFPPLLVYLAASGESAGQLDILLARAADYLDREFDNFTATALSLLEPAIILVMGAIVALIVLAILLPILQLQTLIGV